MRPVAMALKLVRRRASGDDNRVMSRADYVIVMK